jgi:phosphoenolpyruvate---glycerone phosphotransferase subunit DhaK
MDTGLHGGRKRLRAVESNGGTMRKIINNPENFVQDMMKGIYTAHPDQIKPVNGDLQCLAAVKKKPGKVALATGGGSGHLPLFLGYVGEGLLDGCAVGGVFQSPSSLQMLEVTKEIDQGAGVLYIYGNYTGDIMNFDMAAEMAEMEDIEVRSVIGMDDAASAPKGEEHNRRGVAGIFFIYKCAGAAASLMMNLDEVERIARKTGDRVRTMGAALSPCIIPEVGKPNFTINDGEMALGMGIHGEPGIRNTNLLTADELVDEMLSVLTTDMELPEFSEIALLVNGLGATPKEELYIMFNAVAEKMKEKHISIYRTYVGEFATSMEMTGASVSILKLDDELRKLIDYPASSPFFVQR